MSRILVIALAGSLAACATPKSVRELSNATGPFVAETQGSAAAVQRRFAEQTALVDSRVAQWNAYAVAARASYETSEALWRIDAESGGARASVAKGKLLLLEMVRKPRVDAVQPVATAPEPPVAVGSAKLIVLLEEIGKGSLMTPETVAAWIQATDKSLADLRKDASTEPGKEK